MFLFNIIIDLFVKIAYKSNNVYSILCCQDNTCSEKTIDCPSNVCFKLGKIY